MAANPALRLGTALWMEGGMERRALVAPLPSDPGRVVDLSRMERVRLTKLGEGEPDLLAEVLVPPSLRRVLQGGARALARVRQALAYAEKWHRRRPLSEALAPSLARVRLQPCLPRPLGLRQLEGGLLDRLLVRGPGAELHGAPLPTLAWVGMQGGRLGGCCLAVPDEAGTVLGAWLDLGLEVEGPLELCHGAGRLAAGDLRWEGLALPALRPAEVLLLPPPAWGEIRIPAGAPFEVRTTFEVLPLRMGVQGLHPTIQ